jgi:hypothetical protein
MLQFGRQTLGAPRQPLEEEVVTISRAQGSPTFPVQKLIIDPQQPGSFEYLLTFAAVGCNVIVVSRSGTNRRGRDLSLDPAILPRIAEGFGPSNLCVLFTHMRRVPMLP